MTPSSRRTFLQQTGTAAALGFLAQGPARRWLRTPIADLLPERDEKVLRDLVLTAIESARAAGASFADIRLSAARSLTLKCQWEAGGPKPQLMPPGVDRRAGFGLRAMVDGAWGFASGSELTTDALARAGRVAAENARANKPRHRRALPLSPVPVVANGTWIAPIERDPLAVPLAEQTDFMLATCAEVMAVPHAVVAFVNLHWRRPLTLFASTDGTLVVQRPTLAWPDVGAIGGAGPELGHRAPVAVDLPVGGYGYEVLGGATLAARLRDAAGRAVALAEASSNPASVDVGRYDLVFGPDAVAFMLNATLGEALDGENALGYRYNAMGGSFAAPPAELIGTHRLASAGITVRGDRTRPHGAATIGWDEEGVKPEPFALVQDGVIADYLTGRETAPQLQGVHSAAPRPHGIMRHTATVRPHVRIPNLTLDPGRGAATVDDLITDVRRGLYIDTTSGSTDHQVINAQFWSPPHAVRRIANGKLGGYVQDVAFQYLVPQFWKTVDAIGGAASTRASAQLTDPEAFFDDRQPFPLSTVEAVPIRARQVNVLNTGRTA